jgi:hypothetical protein
VVLEGRFFFIGFIAQTVTREGVGGNRRETNATSVNIIFTKLHVFLGIDIVMLVILSTPQDIAILLIDGTSHLRVNWSRVSSALTATDLQVRFECISLTRVESVQLIEELHLIENALHGIIVVSDFDSESLLEDLNGHAQLVKPGHAGGVPLLKDDLLTTVVLDQDVLLLNELGIDGVLLIEASEVIVLGGTCLDIVILEGRDIPANSVFKLSDDFEELLDGGIDRDISVGVGVLVILEGFGHGLQELAGKLLSLVVLEDVDHATDLVDGALDG